MPSVTPKPPAIPEAQAPDPELDWVAWEPDEGEPYRALTKREVQDLQRHAAELEPDEPLHNPLHAHGTEVPDPDCRSCHPAFNRTRLQDIHDNWDMQHPVFREALAALGRAPKGA